MQLPKEFAIDAMTRKEASQLAEWAANEGWNPGLNDIDIAWGYDPGAFIALRRGSELIGGGAILSYRGAAGFMGLFLMRPDCRRQGLGSILWHERLARLRARLRPEAPIGMDGVFNMVPFYEKGGFRLLYRDLRYQGVAKGDRDSSAIPLDELDWAELERFDRLQVPAARGEFIHAWLQQPGGMGLAVRNGGNVSGYGFLRPCRVGFKLGPVFAADTAAGSRLLGSLLSLVPGEQVQLDVPEPNPAAVRFAEDLGWTCAFGCARMVHGQDPGLPLERIWGVTSFEFG